MFLAVLSDGKSTYTQDGDTLNMTLPKPRHIRKRDYVFIIIGTALMAISTSMFYSPANMTPGGFTGLAIILRKLTTFILPGGIPLWAGNLILNVPLLLFSIKLRGWKFIGRTMFAAILFSVHLIWVPEYDVCGGDLFLTAIFGGALMGLGLGIVFVGHATTGGTDTLAALIQHYFPYFSVARILPFLDGTIIAASAFIFGLRVTLYAIVSVILQGMVADEITSGTKNEKLAYIISDSYKEISDAILNEMGRGVTMLHGTGMYTETRKPVLMCAVSRKEIVTLRSIAAEIDPNAFMILSNATEVRGEGFLPYDMKEEL